MCCSNVECPTARWSIAGHEALPPMLLISSSKDSSVLLLQAGLCLLSDVERHTMNLASTGLFKASKAVLASTWGQLVA